MPGIWDLGLIVDMSLLLQAVSAGTVSLPHALHLGPRRGGVGGEREEAGGEDGLLMFCRCAIMEVSLAWAAEIDRLTQEFWQTACRE